jgi:2-(1,2-epoxy-1,2-dihydrophenyl)acetyl-CoA isomerase
MPQRADGVGIGFGRGAADHRSTSRTSSASTRGDGSTLRTVCVLGSPPMTTDIDGIRTEVDERGVATVTIDRPDAGNSLTAQMRDGLSETFDELSATLGVRVVVLTGAGERHFCTGAGLGGPQKPTPPRPEGAPDRATGDVARMIKRGWQRLIASILDCEKPVVAAVNGTAAGGGANLVLACDLVVMADNAKLIEVFVRRGIIPDAGGCYLLPRIVGPQRAKELMFLGDDLRAVDCERWGIANRVVPAAELASTVDELAGRLAAAPSKAVAMTKWLLNRSSESSRHTAFEEEAYAQELIAATADMGEGISAFAERRDPAFRGW